jgi:hypothetical protein
LVVLGILGTAAAGTALVAPFIERGLPSIALATVLLSAAALLSLRIGRARPPA